MRSIQLPEVADLEGLGPRELGRMLGELDRVRRRVEAMIAETIGAGERTVAYAEDGHQSVTGWVRASCNTSKAETKSMVQCSRLLHAIPEAREAAHAGQLGVAQGRPLARVFSNPRCAEQLPGSAELLVSHARDLWFDDFQVVVERWQALADADGVHRVHERVHEERDAHKHSDASMPCLPCSLQLRPPVWSGCSIHSSISFLIRRPSNITSLDRSAAIPFRWTRRRWISDVARPPQGIRSIPTTCSLPFSQVNAQSGVRFDRGRDRSRASITIVHRRGARCGLVG